MRQQENDLYTRFSGCVCQVEQDLRDYHPRAVVLFGSTVGFLGSGGSSAPPGDIDLLMVGDMPPFRVRRKNYGLPLELHRIGIRRMVDIARIIRYDARPVALARLYGSNLVRQHAIQVIAAAALLGSGYNDFGIEQIQLDGRIDDRDYSAHKVLSGASWWQDLTGYARERRGPLGRFSDKLVGHYTFKGI